MLARVLIEYENDIDMHSLRESIEVRSILNLPRLLNSISHSLPIYTIWM